MDLSNTLLLVRRIHVFVIIIFVFFILFVPIQRLYLIEYKSGKILKSFPIKNGEEFTVYFIHSLEKTPWHEIYYVQNDDEIYLKETKFYSFGAGLPSNTNFDFSFDNGSMKIKNYNIEMKNLIYKVRDIIAGHVLLTRGEKYHLNKIAKPSTSVLFQVDKISLFKFFIREVAKIV
ncbi:MAG TPA: DUF1850 domain-containing protein [Eubacteriaceae bacterium]|nr:DUF1850 domain-containing protein [Eubacteriaceae bacterium]